MKTKILVSMVIVLCLMSSGCTSEIKEVTTECAKASTSSSYHLNIVSKEGIVHSTIQVSKSSLSTFSEEEIIGMKEAIRQNALNAELKKVKGVVVTEEIKNKELIVTIHINYLDTDLEKLSELQQIDTYNTTKKELLLDQLVSFQENYYKVVCMETEGGK